MALQSTAIWAWISAILRPPWRQARDRQWPRGTTGVGSRRCLLKVCSGAKKEEVRLPFVQDRKQSCTSAFLHASCTRTGDTVRALSGITAANFGHPTGVRRKRWCWGGYRASKLLTKLPSAAQAECPLELAGGRGVPESRAVCHMLGIGGSATLCCCCGSRSARPAAGASGT